MLRKVTLGLIAAASLSAIALAPTAASAHGFHGGWGHGHGYGFGGLYINSGISAFQTIKAVNPPAATSRYNPF